MNTKTKSVAILVLSIVLSACGSENAVTTLDTPTHVLQITTTPSPTSTTTPLPTATPTLDLPISLNTPLPQSNFLISAENAKNLVEISRWGQGVPRSVTYSPDGRLIIVGASMGIFLYDSQTFQLEKSIDNHNWVDRDRFDHLPVAISSDNNVIAGVSNDNQITLWDVTSGKELMVFSGHTKTVSQLTFSPDGKTLVSSADDKNIKIWDIASGTELGTITAQANSAIPAFDLSPDGSTIAFVTNNGNGEIQVLNVANGTELYTITAHANSTITRITFLPDAQTFASSAGDTTIKVWDATNGKLLKTLKGHTSQVNWFAISQDGKKLASGSLDEEIILWDIESGNKIQSWIGTTWWKGIEAIAFSPDGQTLVSTGGDGLKIWNAASGEELRTVHSCFSYDIDFSIDEKLLGTVSCNDKIKLLDTRTSNEYISLSTSDARAEQLAFSPDNTIMAAGGYDGTIKLWEVATGKEMLMLPKMHNRPIVQLLFSQDGNFLVSQDRYGVAIMWDLTDGSEVYKTSVGAPISLSPDGKMLAGGASISTFPDGTTYTADLTEVALPSPIGLWDATSGLQIQKLSGHSDYVHIAKFSPDSNILASASNDGTVKLWSVANSEELITLFGHTERVFDVAFSPDGKILASVSRDKSMILWDVTSGQKLFEVKGMAGVPYRMAFSPDGSKIALLLTAGAIQLWGIYP